MNLPSVFRYQKMRYNAEFSSRSPFRKLTVNEGFCAVVGVECFMTLFAFRLSFLLFSTCKNFFTGTLDGSLSRKFFLQTENLEIFLAVNLKDWLVVSINFPISIIFGH